MTGGTHAGVMKHVGEAVKDFGIASSSKSPVIAIGIAPWGCIQNKDSLVNDSVCIIMFRNCLLNVFKYRRKFMI